MKIGISMKNSAMTDWIVGGLVAVGGVLALVLTACAVDPVMY